MKLDQMKKLKKERGYSNGEIAGSAGLPLGTVQKVFSGETKRPRNQTLQALEKFFMTKESGSFPAGPVRKKAQKKQGEYTLEDYYALPDDQRVELIDGVFYDMSAPTFVHQRVAIELHGQIRDYISAKGGSCLPLMSPLDVRIDRDDRTMVQPDVIVLCDTGKIRRWGIDGAPDFLAEVLSPSTRKKDMAIKLAKYMEAGVREYWMIDPDKRRLVVYRLEQDELPEVYALTGRVPIGIYGDLFIDLDAIDALIIDYPED